MATPIAAQSTGPSPAPAVDFRISRTPLAIRLDGVLDEAAWRAADSITDFRQRDPQEGAPATERTVVRVLATPNGLAVG